MAIIKLVIIRWKKTDLILVLNMIADDWMKAKSEKEQRVMIRCAQNARIILIFGNSFMIIGLSFVVFLPCFGTSLRYITNITDPDKILPLPTYYIYDKDQTPYYELTFIAQVLLMIMAAASYTGVDNLLGLLVFHLCGQMENLKERLINVRQNRTFSDALMFIVENHIRLIKYFDIVESTFTVMLLGLLLYFGILFCLFGFLIVILLTEGNEISMIRLIYLISIMLNISGHMCLYCVVGEILVAKCEGIYYAAYNCEWYTLEPEKARTLILIMIRANKLLHITAGKMFPMTLSMFCNLVKTSGGYVSVLLASQNFEWAIKLNRFALNIPGLWPGVYKNTCDRFLSDLRTTLSFLLFVCIGLIPTLHSLVRTWNDMIAKIDNLQCTLPLLITIIKLVIIRWKKTDLTLVLKMTADDWLKDKSEKEERVMIKYAQNARTILIFGYFIMIVGLIFVIFLPCFGTSMRYITNITDPGRILPIQTYYLYDKDQTPYYELTFIAQALLMIVGIISYTGVDNLLALLVFHLCGQIENLRERLINIRHKTFYNDIAFIIKDHIRLIKYFDTIENTFTLLLLGLLLYFAILFCLYGFLIVVVLTEGKEMSMIRLIYLLSVVLNVAGHMCLYCVVGEILVAKCEGVYYAAYDYEWYMLAPERAKILILIMIRTHKPLHITAGKFFPMTLSMFCNLVKTSGGYVSVLLASQGS
ncbi:uncharacterized protein LOC126849563 [Cataglyphis hispanica]|uniref:uncharacterized protein LOC126849563 n=1 Tax=Cataglyphis hispanica TaxID=1086592 RepID=UPI00217F9CE9|nr:uncharacterized protein LOC126849563 [Cataglyphis hispanica]